MASATRGPGSGGRTGPRTEAGKARSSRNALRHGLSARRDTPDALARHTEAALGIIAAFAAGRGRDPMPRDATRDWLARKGRIGTHALSVVLPYVAADEQVQRARRAKREALLAAQGLFAFDATLSQSYADIAVGVDRHADEGLDRRVLIEVQAERAQEQIASLARITEIRRRDREGLGHPPFGSPTQPALIKRLGTTSASVLYALRDIARLDRYEARAVSARRTALRKLRHLELLLSPDPEPSEDGEAEDVGEDKEVEEAENDDGVETNRPKQGSIA